MQALAGKPQANNELKYIVQPRKKVVNGEVILRHPLLIIWVVRRSTLGNIGAVEPSDEIYPREIYAEMLIDDNLSSLNFNWTVGRR